MERGCFFDRRQTVPFAGTVFSLRDDRRLSYNGKNDGGEHDDSTGDL